MSVKFFGQFLLERGKITKEQLMEALQFQKSVNLKLGTIALDKGYLNAEQVNTIHAEQQRTDKLFGEIALELGLLNTDQVEELLKIQKGDRIFLGEALVQKNFLSLEDLESELEEFKKDQEVMDNAAKEALRSADTPEVAEAFLALTIKMFARLGDIKLKVLGSHCDPKDIAVFPCTVRQRIKGDIRGFYILSLTERMVISVVSEFIQEKIESMDDIAKDGIKEFVNITVGNAVSKLSLSGIKITLDPPEFCKDLGNIDEDDEIIGIKLGTGDYELRLGIMHKPIVISG